MADKKLVTSKGLTSAKGNYQDALLQLAILVASGVVGGAASAFIGKGSGIIGIVTAGAGVYFDITPLTVAGTAMTANGFSRNGTLGSLEDGKKNLMSYFNNLKHSMYLDKIIKDDNPSLSGYHYIAPSSQNQNYIGVGNLKFVDAEEEAMYRSMFQEAEEVPQKSHQKPFVNAKGQLI